MKLRGYYIKKEAEKNLKVIYDKISKGRPAWVQIEGLPDNVNFISIHLGKKGKEGRRIQFYKTYLPEGLFLPIDYTKEEMKKFYNQFSKIYDKKIKEESNNLKSAKFLCDKLKKYVNTDSSILDLGAGTGLITEVYYNSGFKDITLVDYSKGMLDKAKKNKRLKNCKFIQADITKLNLRQKYDLILSNFSFGSTSYFSEDETKKALKYIKKQLKPKGIFAIIGHANPSLFIKEFKKLDSGIYLLNKKKKFYTDYFIGKKKQHL